ncbi:MAG TPA: hypothetical protein VJW95_07645 [Dissulfurispiraceae bacterium]|nr:hypothetical protein [Dissulfurispiraceae bacterium]
MIKRFTWEIIVGLSLVAVSAVFFLAQITIFHSERDTLFYLLQDLAFLPIQVLLVTIVIDRLLILRERQNMLKKLNMVIGVFFTETGIELLRILSEFERLPDSLRKQLIISGEWGNREFAEATIVFRTHRHQIEAVAERLEQLRHFLLDKREFLLVLLENPILLEHDTFTELLLAVFHLADELAHRVDMLGLPASDYQHLAGDVQRAYHLLIIEWLAYMKHLKNDYPYLFSLAIRMNPFDSNASPIVN